MRNLLLAIHLMIKTVVEFIFVSTVVLACGVIAFLITYLYKSIEQAVDYFTDNRN